MHYKYNFINCKPLRFSLAANVGVFFYNEILIWKITTVVFNTDCEDREVLFKQSGKNQTLYNTLEIFEFCR